MKGKRRKGLSITSKQQLYVDNNSLSKPNLPWHHVNRYNMGNSLLSKYNWCIFILNGCRIQIFWNTILDKCLVLCFHFLNCPPMQLFKILPVRVENFQSISNTTSKWSLKCRPLCIFSESFLQKNIQSFTVIFPNLFYFELFLIFH